MGKKGKKRRLDDDTIPGNVITKRTESLGNKDLPKKKKLKTSVEDVATAKIQEVKSANNIDGAKTDSKTFKKKKKKTKKQKNDKNSASDETTHLQNNAEQSKEITEGDKESKIKNSRKEKFKRKRQQYKEIRKEIRKEEGNFNSVNKLSLEELKKKIAEIEARETISKTAIRKLRILKKKLSVEEGTINDVPTSKRKVDALQEGASNKANKKFKKDDQIKTELRSQKNMENTEKNKQRVNKQLTKDVSKKTENILDKEDDNLKIQNKVKKQNIKIKQEREQPLFIEDRQGNKTENTNKKKNKNSIEESEVIRAKRILEEVLSKKKVKAEKVGIENGNKEKDFDTDEEKDIDTDEEYGKLIKGLDWNDDNSEKEDIDDNTEDSEEDDNDDNDNNDEKDIDDSNNDDEEDINDNMESSEEDDTKINESKVIVKTNKNIEQDISKDEEKDDGQEDEGNKEIEEEETSDSVEAENNKSQQPLVKEIKEKDKSKNFSKQKLQSINQNANTGKKQRYVLFIGNLSYDATPVDIKKHFLVKVDKVTNVRIPSKPGSNKPRGFAYIEFENSIDYEKGLSLHDTFINGRKINVQYTSSGSKNIKNKQEIVHKNKKLHAMRQAGMLAGSKKNFQKRSFRRKPDRKMKSES